MNKLRTPLLAAIAGVLAGVILTLLFTRVLFPPEIPRTAGTYTVDENTPPTNAQLTAIALEAAGYLRTGDMEALSELVHPEYGLIFSPSATVNLNTNLCFPANEVAALSENTDKLTWGVLTDGGEPISMTFGDFLSTYIYAYDYSSAPIIGVDTLLRTGNALDNVTVAFPNAHFVDLCWPGTEAAGYADWSILRLVFERSGSELYLTALIHSDASI